MTACTSPNPHARGQTGGDGTSKVIAAIVRTRKEFTQATKREAMRRSGKRCEAVGEIYGLDHGQPDAAKNFDNSPENCAAICPRCHAFKTPKDVTMHAKVKRMSDRHSGIRPKSKWPSPFNQNRVSSVKQIHEVFE